MVTTIIISQISIISVWWLIRRYMTISDKFNFDIDALHHFDALLINVALPVWIALGVYTPGLVCLCISLIAAADDMYQHWYQAKYNLKDSDPKSWSPLKKLLRPLWTKAFKR